MRVALSLVVALLFAGCGPDLGTCDMAAATQVVYAADGTPYYEGQALVQQSCAGNYCHVSTATGANRFGAPHGLDFDVAVLSTTSQPAAVLALQTGVAKVRDEASDMYGEIEGGTMPPGKNGERIPQGWTHADGSVAALDIRTDQSKTVVRNWLACQAPVVAGVTGAPMTSLANSQVVQPKVVMTAATFTSVYDTVLKGSCIGCHVAGGPFAAMTPLDFSTSATAYTSLFGKDASPTNPKCSGHGKLVVAGNCQSSLLYQKLLPVTPPATAVCGDAMPLGGDPIAAPALKSLCDWITAGALQN